MALTVKGHGMNKQQQDAANALLGIGTGLKAPTVALVAIIFCAIYESGLGVELGANSGGHGGILGGSTSIFGDVNASLIAQATAWYTGGNGFGAGGGIKAAGNAAPPDWTNPAVLGSQVEGAVPYDSQGISTQYEGEIVPHGIQGTVREAEAIVKAYGGGALSISGASPNTASATTPFYVGDTSNPDEDVWTAVNRLAQDRQWYIFSDGEVCYLADGTDLMAQPAVMTLDRWRDADKIQHLDFTWDNTAYQYTSTHKRRKRTQRKSTLAKVTSATEGTLEVICPIDQVRGGDIIELSGCGPGDGKWLVGDCTRSVFKVYSQIQLVPGIEPLTEVEAEGGTSGAFTAANQPVPQTGTGRAVGGVVNPVPGASITRLDMGVDGVGTTIVAPYNGVVHNSPRGWPNGGNYFYIVNDDQTGPDYTRAMYFAEHMYLTAKDGSHVTQGQQIGSSAPGSWEFGPAAASLDYDPLAKVYGLGSSGAHNVVTAFYNWLRAAGMGPSNNPGHAGSA